MELRLVASLELTVVARVCDFEAASQPGLESDISVAKVTRPVIHSLCRLLGELGVWSVFS